MKIATIRENVLRPEVAAAWQRCQQLGINPNHLCHANLSVKELKEKKRANSILLEILIPHMECLSKLINRKPHLLALADSQGWVIEVQGVADDVLGIVPGLIPGVRWTENYCGNNAIGTALAQGEPVMVCGAEHYVRAFKNFSGVGVPLKKDGVINAVLCVYVNNKYAHLLNKDYLSAYVKAVENNFAVITRLQNNLKEAEILMGVGSLLATTVHDLKNPLSIIRGLGQLGQSTSDPFKGKNYFDKIVFQCDVLTDMLGELMGTFKTDDYALLMPDVVIDEVLTDFDLICRMQGIRVEFIKSECPQVALKKNLFKRAIHNIIKNAVQNMNDGGKLSVRISTRNVKLLINIEDTGTGIPFTIKDRIFKPFVCGRGKGTGLGLYMVHYAISRVHRGRVWFETQQGRGTNFNIEIPL
ncbi:MAG: two-component sensor histidine kinase [Tissierellia bacterium]|nr:two-component sensor histidine kinase [Tissierellia bacterium]